MVTALPLIEGKPLQRDVGMFVLETFVHLHSTAILSFEFIV